MSGNFLKQILLTSLFLLALPPNLVACSCTGITFCELVHRSYFAIAFKGEVIDNVEYDDGNVAIYIAIEKVYRGDNSVTDTIKLYGSQASSVLCEFDVVSKFPIGTEMIAAVGRSSQTITNPDAATEDYWEVKTSPCIFVNLQISNGNVNGAVAPEIMEYAFDEFEENFDDCISINSDLKKIKCSENNLLVFPNPTFDGNVNLISNFFENSIAQINVYASNGKFVKTRNHLDIGFSNNISLSQLPKGVHVLEIISKDDQKCYRKILVL